jgi:hypothetical protein
VQGCLGGISVNVRIAIGAEKRSYSSGGQSEHGTEGVTASDEH